MTFFIGLLKIEARSINVNSDSSIDNVKIHVKIGAKEDNIELKKLINTSDSTLYYIENVF